MTRYVCSTTALTPETMAIQKPTYLETYRAVRSKLEASRGELKLCLMPAGKHGLISNNTHLRAEQNYKQRGSLHGKVSIDMQSARVNNFDMTADMTMLAPTSTLYDNTSTLVPDTNIHMTMCAPTSTLQRHKHTYFTHLLKYCGLLLRGLRNE